MIKLALVLVFSTLLFAQYSNCKFKNKNYENICKRTVKLGVSYEYTNTFLMSYFKANKFDEVSWKYLQPKHIKKHSASEKKANNALVKSIPLMVENLKKYEEVYNYVETEYHVNREVIAAILLKETKLGLVKPKHDAFIVFNTIVRRINPITRRSKRLLEMGKSNMVAIIEHCYKIGLSANNCTLNSSYAGAVGIPQFMPNSFKYAEAYKSKLVDLTKMEDAIVSAAKFLNKKSKFKELIEWEKMPNIIDVEHDWYEYDFVNKNASFVYEKSKSGKKYNCFTKNKNELTYLRKYTKKIMSYNNSSNYAVGVMRLAYEAHLLLNSK